VLLKAAAAEQAELTPGTAAVTAVLTVAETMAEPVREDIPVTAATAVVMRGPAVVAARREHLIAFTVAVAAASVFLGKGPAAQEVSVLPVSVMEVVAAITETLLICVVVVLVLAVRAENTAEAGVLELHFKEQPLALSALFGQGINDNSLQLVLDFHKWNFTFKFVTGNHFSILLLATILGKHFRK
jgi:hypothetical protein